MAAIDLRRELADPRWARLEGVLREYGPTLTAYSGGVDSTLVAVAAARVHGEAAMAVTGVSASLAGRERSDAARVAERLGLRHREVETHEMQREGYRANAGDRCYHCKSDLFERLDALRTELGFAVVASGENLDDMGDHRPGLRAARELSVRTPLVDAGLDKAAVRAMADQLGLPNAQKPAAPCLASRVPHGRRVSPEVLAQIERAEAAVRALGFEIFRVRHHGEVARLEIPRAHMARALELRERLDAELRAAGYAFVALDLRGFRSGSLNVLLDEGGRA